MYTDTQGTEYRGIFQISPTVRVVAKDSPWQVSTGVYASNYGIHLETIQSARGMADYVSSSDYSQGIQEIIGDHRYKGDFTMAIYKIGKYLDNANKYAHRSPDDLEYVYTFHTLKGYSQGEWNEVVAYSNQFSQEQLEEIVKGEIDTFYKGEVYEVSVQHAKVFTSQDGEELLKWDTDEDFEYVEVVEEFFTLTADFIQETYGLEVLPEVEG
jgi:hypothetical protein